MIQRIQTFYLLIAMILMAIILLVPFGKLLIPGGELVDFTALGANIPKADGTIEQFTALPLTILISLCVFLNLISVVLFKKRMIQIRISAFNIILMLGSIGLMYYFMRHAQNTYSIKATYNILMVFPLISAILTFLAIRSIGRDEALIRSVDRIR